MAQAENKTIMLDEHHQRIIELLQGAEREVTNAQSAVKKAEQDLAAARERASYYRGQLDLLGQFAQYAQPQPAPPSE